MVQRTLPYHFIQAYQIFWIFLLHLLYHFLFCFLLKIYLYLCFLNHMRVADLLSPCPTLLQRAYSRRKFSSPAAAGFLDTQNRCAAYQCGPWAVAPVMSFPWSRRSSKLSSVFSCHVSSVSVNLERGSSVFSDPGISEEYSSAAL